MTKMHWADCAVNDGPAYPAGPCNCGAFLPPNFEGREIPDADLHPPAALQAAPGAPANRASKSDVPIDG